MLAEAASIGCSALAGTACFARRAGAGLRVVGLRRDLDLSMPLIDGCRAMGARRLDPWTF